MGASAISGDLHRLLFFLGLRRKPCVDATKDGKRGLFANRVESSLLFKNSRKLWLKTEQTSEPSSEELKFVPSHAQTATVAAFLRPQQAFKSLPGVGSVVFLRLWGLQRPNRAALAYSGGPSEGMQHPVVHDPVPEGPRASVVGRFSRHTYMRNRLNHRPARPKRPICVEFRTGRTRWTMYRLVSFQVGEL